MQAFGVGETVKLATGFSEITIGFTSADEEPQGFVATISILKALLNEPAVEPQLVVVNKCAIEFGIVLCVYEILDVLSFTLTE